MRLSELIERLTEIQKEDDTDCEVYLYTELGGICTEDMLKDIAVSNLYTVGDMVPKRSRIILIGTEED